MARVAGTVVAVTDGCAIVECATLPSGCSTCASGGGCRGFAATPGSRTLSVPLPAGESWRPGDLVELTVDETALLRGALRLYLPPLAGVLAGPALLHAWGGATGAWELAAGAVGLLAGLVAARLWTQRTPTVRVSRA
jgi:sigma-E factor negative regulatory protein RseC